MSKKKSAKTPPADGATALVLTKPQTQVSVTADVKAWAAKVATLDEIERLIAAELAKDALRAAGWTVHARLVRALVKKAEPAATVMVGQKVVDPDPPQWETEVDGAALLTVMRDAFTKYCLLPTWAAEALALWTLYTHCVGAFDFNPFVALLSPVKRCGKTRVEDVSSAMAARSHTATNMNAANIYRITDAYHPTMFLDELDTWDKVDKAYKGILNGAHTRSSAWVDRQTGAQFEHSRRFSTYTAYMFALIGTLPETLLDRCIVIHMKRKKKSEIIVLFRRSEVAALLPLKRRCIRWAADHVKALRDAAPTVPDELDDRAADIWRVLFAIADACGGPWPAWARDAARVLSSGDLRQDTSLPVRLLRSIHSAYEETGKDRLGTEQLVTLLRTPDDEPWKHLNSGRGLNGDMLADFLRPFGITSTTLYFPGDLRLKGYYRKAFEDDWATYGIPVNVTAVTSTGIPVGISNKKKSAKKSPSPHSPLGASVAVTAVTLDPPVTTDWKAEKA